MPRSANSPVRPAPAADQAADPLDGILRQLADSRDVLVARWARALAKGGHTAAGERAAGDRAEAVGAEDHEMAS